MDTEVHLVHTVAAGVADGAARSFSAPRPGRDEAAIVASAYLAGLHRAVEGVADLRIDQVVAFAGAVIPLTRNVRHRTEGGETRAASFLGRFGSRVGGAGAGRLFPSTTNNNAMSTAEGAQVCRLAHRRLCRIRLMRRTKSSHPSRLSCPLPGGTPTRSGALVSKRCTTRV